MSASAGTATLDLELEDPELEMLEEGHALNTRAHPADVLESRRLAREREQREAHERRTRIYVRVWREREVVTKNGQYVWVTVRKWRVVGTWLEILHEQQEATNPDSDDYPWTPDLTGLRLLEGVPDSVLWGIPDLEEEIERMGDENQRWRNLQSIRTAPRYAPSGDVFTHELDAARARLRAARAQVEAALDRWDRRSHALAAFRAANPHA